MAEWHTSATVKLQWTTAGKLSTDALNDLVEAAKEQCIEFVRDQREDGWEPPNDIPFAWRRAHLLEVKALWNAEQANPSDGLGEGDQSVRVYPMGQTIKDLLVPKRATPGLG